MGSKGFLLLGLLAAIVLLIISSEVAARDLDETSTAVKPNANDETSGSLDDAKYGGYGGGRGGYGGGRDGGGYGGGGHCRYGCCGDYYGGGGCRCCFYPGEVAEDAEIEAKPHN
ncbi:hypothetical protein LWI28_001390 [Acer negundo]|uniref:Glycine-rich protein n=1 Tax=Acer negundo TaxID=4023 RepID=A0AAD5IY68_ACENE|nr:hypothetical protein LWI28_001390 [Acer negundo]KAK4845502.1 hypothetical protein QYF36_005855 [Acer negundo]